MIQFQNVACALVNLDPRRQLDDILCSLYRTPSVFDLFYFVNVRTVLMSELQENETKLYADTGQGFVCFIVVACFQPSKSHLYHSS